MASKVEDAEIMMEMAMEAEDVATGVEAMALVDEADAAMSAMELQRMLGGRHDVSNCFVAINAGAGGTESQDWAEMLLRMITRYCDRKGFQSELADINPGTEAGIASATLRVEGSTPSAS
ncbi:MAG: PCRF domain-containing protein [bacterium]